MKILIIGNGYLGSRCATVWQDATVSDTHIHSVEDVRTLIDQHQPDAVLNAAGIVGKPNVDWCEDHQMETIKGNTILPLFIAQACQKNGIYLLHLGTGCVFYGRSPHADGMWQESDHANPIAAYSKAKYAADLSLSLLPNVGIARLRMPIDHIPHPANLIDKIATYPMVVDVINSVSVVDDLIGALHGLLEQRASGIFHTVNPGAISHREIVDLYKRYVDSAHTNEWITEEELVTKGLAKKKRSNNIMRTDRLAEYGITMREVHEAVLDTMKKYADAKKA